MDIIKQKQFLLSEITINQPGNLKKFTDYMHILDFFGGELPLRYEQAKQEALRSGYELTLQEYTQADQNSTMREDVSDFSIGSSKQSDGHKSTVTDVDPTTQSVTWKIEKEIDETEIWNDLNKVIKKFETIQTKHFHSKPKLIQLIKDLKTIRNKFSRTITK